MDASADNRKKIKLSSVLKNLWATKYTAFSLHWFRVPHFCVCFLWNTFVFQWKQTHVWQLFTEDWIYWWELQLCRQEKENCILNCLVYVNPSPCGGELPDGAQIEADMLMIHVWKLISCDSKQMSLYIVESHSRYFKDHSQVLTSSTMPSLDPICCNSCWIVQVSVVAANT